MTMKAARRCHECGTGKVIPVAKAGRQERYRTLMLEIPAHVEIPTCDNCGAEWMDPGTARAIDEALKSVYQASLRTLLNKALIKIRARTSMRRVERLLGLSEGYLSKVSNSRSEPSAELVSNLGLISMNPTSRLRDLETFWTLSKKRAASTGRKSPRPSKTSSAAIEQRP
jgi:hypothetical protein